MNTITPITRISLSLALLTLGILLSGSLFFGQASDDEQIKMQARARQQLLRADRQLEELLAFSSTAL